MSQGPPANQNRLLAFLLIVVAIALFSFSFAIFVRKEVSSGRGSGKRGGLGPGEVMPAIIADGWLNGPGPKAESLKGKVLVVDAWAYWCGPCKAEAPHLVDAYQASHDRGAVFIGLTSDEEKDVDKMKEFLSDTKITWPCGYGATETLSALKNEFIPQVWVVGADGKVRWTLDSSGTLDDAIDEALAVAPVVDTPKKPR